MKFIARDDELKRLDKILDSDFFTFSLIYGRRRIGKSELVKHAIKNKDCLKIYYECKEVNELSNVESLSEVLSDKLNLPTISFKNMESILDYIFKLSLDRKIILVLDEYSYLKSTIKGIDSIIQSLVDKYKDSSNMSFIILGSFVDIMKSLLLHSNPLYGRIDFTIELKEMNYYDSSLFYPNFSNEDKVRIYSVFGGIPYYNSLLDDSKSVKENIINLIASNNSRLENEVSMYLNSEISKIANANEVFEALAKGYTKYSDILSQSHVSSSPTLVDVLDKLIKMGIVSKVGPINDMNNKRKIGYYIKDNLSLFYYRYIFKYLSQLKIMDSDIFFSKYIEKDFEEKYVPKMFEKVCYEYLAKQNKKGLIEPVIEQIGKYYYDDKENHTNGEFDIVTKDEKGYVFYEAKFRNSPLTNSIVKEEIRQVNLTPLDCYKYVFFSKSNIEATNIENVEYKKLDELYE